MSDGELPANQKMAIRREDLRSRLQAPFQGLAHLHDLLADVLARQKSSFSAANSKICPQEEEEGDLDVPPDPDEPVPERDEQAAEARFAPSSSWRRLSDYVAHLAKRFEEKWTNPRTERVAKLEARPGAIHRPIRFCLQRCVGRGSPS